MNFSKNDLQSIQLKKTKTEEKSLLGDEVLGKIVDTEKNDHKSSKQSNDSITKTEIKAPPSNIPPPNAPILSNTKPKEKKTWKVDLNEPIMDEKNIQIDPDIDSYPKHEYDDILCVSIQSPYHSAQHIPNYLDNFLKNNFKERKPDFLLFPEDSFGSTTFSGGLDNKNQLIDEIAKVIKKHQVYVILGTTAEVEMNGFKKVIYNTAPFFNKNGVLFGTYRKRKSTMGGAEGNKVGVFKTQFGLMSIMICFDIENKDIFKETLLYKPRIIFNPTYIPLRSEQNSQSLKIKQQSLSSLFEKICLDNDLTIIRSDQRNLGFSNGCTGSSQIISPIYNERSCGSFETFLINFVPKNSKELLIYEDITIPPERTRTLETDNIEQRYFIDNFQFGSSVIQCGFLKDWIIGLSEKNEFKIHHSESNLEGLKLKDVQSFNIFKDELCLLQKNEISLFKECNKIKSFSLEENELESINMNEKFIFIGTKNGSLLIFERENQKLISTISLKSSVQKIEFLNEKQLIISKKESFIIYDYEFDKILFESFGKVYDNFDKKLYFKRDKDLYEWDQSSEKLMINDFYYEHLKILNDKKWIVIHESQMKLFNSETRNIDFIFKSHHSKINCITWNQFNMILTGGHDRLLKCWDFQNNRVPSDLKKLFK